MLSECARNGFSKQWGYGIANLFELLNTRSKDPYVVRKRLKPGRLPNGESSLLRWVNKSAPMQIALGKYGARQTIRMQTTVTLGVITTSCLLHARGKQLDGYISPTSALRDVLQALDVYWRQPGGNMIKECLALLAQQLLIRGKRGTAVIRNLVAFENLQMGKIENRITHSYEWQSSGTMGWIWKFERRAVGTSPHEENPAAFLRDTKLLRLQCVLIHLIAEFGQTFMNLFHCPALTRGQNARNILNHHGFWLKSFNQAQIFPEQSASFIMEAPLMVINAVGLAGGATNKAIQITGREVQRFHKQLWFHSLDWTLNKERFWMRQSIGLGGARVDIVSCQYAKPLLAKALGKSPGSAEKVYAREFFAVCHRCFTFPFGTLAVNRSIVKPSSSPNG